MLATANLHIQNTLNGKGKSSSRNTALLAAATLLAVLPFESEHLLLMFLGAFVYFVFYGLQPKVKQRVKNIEIDRTICSTLPSGQERPRRTPRPVQSVVRTRTHTEPRFETRSNTVSPVEAPKFQGSTWEEEVAELLVQITPTANCERVVAQLTSVVKKAIWATFPDAEVMGFTSGNLQGGKAFGVAVPDVDIVVNLKPQTLMQRMQQRSRGRVKDTNQFGFRQLQKYAIRLCTERLVSATNLKFRRSAFRGSEPKVTLLAPAEAGFSDTSVPVDFCVNSATPFHNAALMTECGKIDPRARALILLVKRWAKDRGICHSAKGHLSPYAWTLLAIYFLQVGADESPLLPPISGFEVSSGLSAKRSEAKSGKPWIRTLSANPGKSVSDLFLGFFRFYVDFDWRKEAISVETGKRGPPSLSLPLQILDDGDEGRGTEVGPSVEDPFAKEVNLSSGMTAWSFTRMKEELKRANALGVDHASLAVLLEPWVPPDLQPDDPACDQCEMDTER